LTGDAFHTPIIFRKDDLVKNVEVGKIEEARLKEERNRIEDRVITWIHSGIDKAG
jgi:hypothetical protein